MLLGQDAAFIPSHFAMHGLLAVGSTQTTVLAKPLHLAVWRRAAAEFLAPIVMGMWGV